jgi:hypothetical protein
VGCLGADPVGSLEGEKFSFMIGFFCLQDSVFSCLSYLVFLDDVSISYWRL